MSEEDETFDPELRSLLKSAAPEGPSPEERARLGARLEHAIAGAAIVGAVGVAASSSLRAKIALVATGLALGGGVGSAITYRVLADRPERVVYVDRPAPVPPALPPPSAAPPPPSSSASITPPPITPSASAASNVASFAAERRLLDDARTAYMRGDTGAALTKLDAHATEFPRGRLAEEREALAIRVLVDAGRTKEARARGKAFEARYPSSLMLPAVQAALRSIEEPIP